MNQYAIILKCKKLGKTLKVTIWNRYWDNAQQIAKQNAIDLFPDKPTDEWDWEIYEMTQLAPKRKCRMF